MDMNRETVNAFIDAFIVPAEREGRVVHTNGAYWCTKVGDLIVTFDITGQYSGNPITVQTCEEYARAWGMTMPLHTRPAEPEATNWLAPVTHEDGTTTVELDYV